MCPDLDEATSSVERMIGAARRASEVVARLRALARQSSADYTPLVIDQVIEEVLPLVRRELTAHDVALEVTADCVLAPRSWATACNCSRC